MVVLACSLLAFLGHFTQTIATRFGLDKPLLPVLRGFVDRLVYPRIYDLCFHRLRGANVLEKRDARYGVLKNLGSSFGKFGSALRFSCVRPQVEISTASCTSDGTCGDRN
jgi:hypothetical protein